MRRASLVSVPIVAFLAFLAFGISAGWADSDDDDGGDRRRAPKQAKDQDELLTGNYVCSACLAGEGCSPEGVTFFVNVDGTGTLSETSSFSRAPLANDPAAQCDALATETAALARALGCAVGNFGGGFGFRLVETGFDFVCTGPRSDMIDVMAKLNIQVLTTGD